MPQVKHALKVWREGYGDTFETADDFEFENYTAAHVDVEDAAEEYAEYYHDERDGWEDSWPITFTVAKENGEILGRVEVEREARPHFSGRVLP